MALLDIIYDNPSPISIPTPREGLKPSVGQLYLGALDDVGKFILTMFPDEKVTIVNLVSSIPYPYDVVNYLERRGNSVTIERYHWRDSPDFDILSEGQLFDVLSKLDSALHAGDNVIIHCHLGISRSAAVVIAYLMGVTHWPYDTCFAHVRRQRKIQPSVEFRYKLSEIFGTGKLGIDDSAAAEQVRLLFQTSK